MQELYMQALYQEISGSCWGAAAWQDTPPSTVYIGGGTPTVLPSHFLPELVRFILRGSRLPADLEVTVEANPGTVSLPQLCSLRKAGVNRISFGVQSFADALLHRIGRLHDGRQAVQAVRAAKKAGFDNISIDLMYGLPGQTLQALVRDLAVALELGIQHISIYGLQVEPGTVFAAWQAKNKLFLPTEAETDMMYTYLTESLPAHGYQRYEISNFALPGFASRHNLGYWQDVPYLGFGAAAHSYWQGQRMVNEADIASYIAKISAGESVCKEEEPQTRAIAMEEFCFLALRTAAGIDKQAFMERFGCPIAEIYGSVIHSLADKGFLRDAGGSIFLTSLGMRYGNQAFADFLLT